LSPRITNPEPVEGEPAVTEGLEGEIAPEGDSTPAPADAEVH